MIRVSNIHVPLSCSDDTLKKKVCRELKINDGAVKSLSLHRRSIDARKKDNIYFLCSVDIELYSNENAAVKKCKNASIVKPYNYEVPVWSGDSSPLVVGMGPAGLFAALILAQSGAKPIVIERGSDVDSRTADVDKFWISGKLNCESNVQFGEGGAGTFSDGKLNTGTKDNRQRKVLNEFVSHGAPEEILYNAKPHIGTDKLKITVKSIREEIISLGGTVMFETKLTGIKDKDGKITGGKGFFRRREDRTPARGNRQKPVRKICRKQSPRRGLLQDERPHRGQARSVYVLYVPGRQGRKRVERGEYALHQRYERIQARQRKLKRRFARRRDPRRL